MASIRERIDAQGKTTFQAQVRITGFPNQSRTFISKRAAERWSKQTEVDIQSGKFIRQSRSTARTVAALLDEYEKTVLPMKKAEGDTGKAAFQYWRKQLGANLLSSVTPKVVEEHRDRLAVELTSRNKPRAPATVLRYMMVLSHAFSTAVKWDWCDRNPVDAAAKPKINNRRVRYLSDEERERLLTACRASDNQDIYQVVVLAISTGMRRGEIMGMHWEALTFYEDRGFAKLRLGAEETKNGTARTVFVASRAFEVLRQRRADLTSSETRGDLTGLVFPSNVNPQNPVDLRAPWEAALKQAEIQDFRFHDLRHTAASYMAMNGATTLEIKEVLGHKSTAMAERYSHLSQTHVDDVVLRMNERHFGKSVAQV